MCRENEFRVVVGRHQCEQSIESLPTDILHAQRQAYGIYGFFFAKKRKTMDDTKGKNISTVTFSDAKIDDAERFVIHPLHSKRSHGACSCSCVMQDYSFSQRTSARSVDLVKNVWNFRYFSARIHILCHRINMLLMCRLPPPSSSSSSPRSHCHRIQVRLHRFLKWRLCIY